MRICLNCGSDKTSLRDKIEKWYHYKDGYVCHKCRCKLIDNTKRNPITVKKWNEINNKKWGSINSYRRMKFKDKVVLLKENPKKGICSLCGAVKGIDCKQTQMHHLEYHNDDPLKDTIEICASCHATIHMSN